MRAGERCGHRPAAPLPGSARPAPLLAGGVALTALAFGGALLAACSPAVTGPPAATGQRHATTTTVPDTLTGYGATVPVWDRTRAPDAEFEGFPAFGPTIQTPLGPTPRYIDVIEQGDQIDQYVEILPEGTSLDAAKALALLELPPDTTVRSFIVDIDSTGQSCALWNLHSATVRRTIRDGGGSLSIEMAHNDANGLLSYRPDDVNVLFFGPGRRDARSPC